MATKVCIIGCGAIGSLYAAHLASVAEVYALVRRPQQAEALNREGLRVSGKHNFTAAIRAATGAKDLPQFDLGIVCTKATQTEQAFAPVASRFKDGAVISAQNGLGSEEVIARHTSGFVIRGTTFMSGTRHSDTHVEYELDTATWLGPFEPSRTPFAAVQQAAELIVRSGLKAEALEDAKPAQWTKLIFNAAVNGVSALTELPHCAAFADESKPGGLGHLLHDLIREGVKVAAARGIKLHQDPWAMNQLGAQTNHPPSMLYDVRRHLATEVDFLGGAIALEARHAGIEAPLHSAITQLIKGKEHAWASTEGGNV